MTIEPVAHGGAGWKEAVALRRAVLRSPLGLDFTAAELAAERHQLHLLLRIDGAPAGTVVVVPPDPDGEGRLRQMAVAPGFAGGGYGSALLATAEAALWRLGCRVGRLHARRMAEGFYARHAWVAEGDGFEEVGLPHVLMRQALQRAAPLN